MPITHTNAKGKTSYLHQGTTKTGKPKYHFSMQSEGTLADPFLRDSRSTKIPMPRCSYAAFLRRSLPMRNVKVVEDGMRKYAEVQDYKIDVQGQRHCSLYRRSG